MIFAPNEPLRPRPKLLFALLVLEGIFLGAVVAALVVGLNARPTWAASDVLVLAAWSIGFYGVLGALAGLLVAALDLALARGPGRSRPRLVLAARLAALLPFAAWTAWIAGLERPWLYRPWPEAPLDDPLPAPADDDPPPVTLLVIDGADLDDQILPGIEAGELPTFARLLDESTWGFLESSIPTRSPALWTSIITGQPRSRHGILHFVHRRLAGVDHTLRWLPRRSGLYQLLSRLERGDSQIVESVPYTRRDWLARPLWDIVAERYPVGVYHWLVTWPAEPVSNGFVVAGGVYAGPGKGWNPAAQKWLDQQTTDDGTRIDATGWVWPPDLFDGLDLGEPSRPTRERIAAYVAPGTPIEPGHKDFVLIRSGLAEPTLSELPALIEAYEPKFVAANFFTVDAFQHRFSKRQGTDDPFAGAIEARYRDVDRALARLLDSLDDDGHLLVVSDHGFDFELDHHWEAPPGLFLARGPAFEAGRRLDEPLHLLDIAPLSLDLLGFPLANDLPGAVSEDYRRAFDPAHDRPRPPRVPTFERGEDPFEASDDDGPAELTPQQEEQLRSLGYIG